MEWRIRRANLPERWTLETFPFARQPGVNRKQIRGFAELEFITKAENIVLVGKTGVGKTGLSCGLLLKALENGYRCQFIQPKVFICPISFKRILVRKPCLVASRGELNAPAFDNYANGPPSKPCWPPARFVFSLRPQANPTS